MIIFQADPYKSGKGGKSMTWTSEPGICLTYSSVDFLFLVIWLIRCSSALMTQVNRQNLLHKRVWANDIKRGIGQRSHCFDVCRFDAKSTSIYIRFVTNACRSTSLANKKTLNNISEPAICHEYWSEDSLMQQPSLKHLNLNVRYNNNALVQLNDCIEVLLHLVPNVIRFRTLLNLWKLLHLSLPQDPCLPGIISS